ncbi:sensor histidine kinase [Aequorivita capsosiphonis]|uniref:sensor histidine kinase n=1 Tax=Aequorivita capsosiphonis TaxID=487317 RepID=UPI00040E6DAE|nr:sensor histidine kinase [Aequorivita capsosiphonis]
MKRIRKIGFTNFILLVSSLILVIVLIGFSFIMNANSASEIAHTWEVKNNIRRVSASISQMESLKLANVYTNQIKYKHAFAAAHEDYDSLMDALKVLVNDNPLQLERVLEVENRVDRNFSEFKKVKPINGMVSIEMVTQGKQEMIFVETIQSYLEEMIVSENILLEKRNQSYVVWKFIILGILALATIIVFLSLYSLINKIKPLVEELFQTKNDFEDSNRNLQTTLAELKLINAEKELEIVAKESAVKQADKLNESLLAKNQQLDHFAYVASHDLQEPLRTVTNYLEIFQEDFPERVEGEATMYFDFINSAVERMRNLISGLLSFSRIGTSGEPEGIDLNLTLSRIKDDFSAVIEEREIIIESDHLPTYNGHRIEIKQLFQNLISNAIKFTKPEVTPHIKISFDETEHYYNFHIIDNGIGIPDKDFAKVFDMFSRLHSTKDYEGQGIGLAFCKKIVELHRGNIWVTSKFGEGTSVHFTLKK